MVEAVVTLKVTLTNRATGTVLFARNGAEFRERYEISIDPKAYFDESGTAMDRLSRSVANTVIIAGPSPTRKPIPVAGYRWRAADTGHCESDNSAYLGPR